MKKIYTIVTTYLIISLITGACTKTNIIDSRQRTDMLINKKWQLILLTSQGKNGVVINGIDSLPVYRKDDYLLFKEDSTFEYNDNLDLRPGFSAPILDAGDWKLIRENKSLELFSTIYTKTYPPFDILELTDSKLYLQTKSEGDGSKVLMTFKPIR